MTTYVVSDNEVAVLFSSLGQASDYAKKSGSQFSIRIFKDQRSAKLFRDSLQKNSSGNLVSITRGRSRQEFNSSTQR